MALSRRTLAQGAAWAVPTVTLAAAAPAMAASSSATCDPCIQGNMSFGGMTNGNGWQQLLIGSVTTKSTQAYQSSWAPTAAINASCNHQTSTTTVPALSDVFLFSKNPTQAGTELFYGREMCIPGDGVTNYGYTFYFNWNAYALNNYGIYGRAEISTSLGGTPIAQSADIFIDGCSSPSATTQQGTGCQTANLTGSGSVAFQAQNPGPTTYYFQYHWWFEPNQGDYTEGDCGDQFNDIAFQEPYQVSCAQQQQ